MKTLKLLAIILLLTSCSPEDNDGCDCTKETYRFEQGTTINSSGLPVLTSQRVTLSTEQVPCQDEQEQVEQGNGIIIDITCQ